MKKIFLIIILLLSVNVYSNNTELTTLEKQTLLEWTNAYCDENHKNYESFLKDRYFVCEKRNGYNVFNPPKGLHGVYRFEETALIKTDSNGIFYWFFVSFFVILLISIYILIVHIQQKKWEKEYKENLLREGVLRQDDEKIINKINSYKQLKSLVFKIIVFGLIYVVYSNGSEALKSHSIETLKNGNVENVKKTLPLFNIFKEDETALILAVYGGSFDVVKYLIEEEKEDPNEYGTIDFFTKNITPLDLALNIKSYEIADYLKQYLPADKAVSITVAAKSFDIELLKKSVKLTSPTKEDIIEGFLTSIDFADNKAMEYLYHLDPAIIDKQGSFQNFSRETAIDIAIERNNLEAVKFLISNNAKINECGILSSAAFYDRVKIFNLLVEHGADVNLKCQRHVHNIFIQIVRGKAKRLEQLVADKGFITAKEFKNIKEDVYYGQLDKYEYK